MLGFYKKKPDLKERSISFDFVKGLTGTQFSDSLIRSSKTYIRIIAQLEKNQLLCWTIGSDPISWSQKTWVENKIYLCILYTNLENFLKCYDKISDIHGETVFRKPHLIGKVNDF